ncbi:MAG: hypothetical protein JWM80_2681 [Cyanobacteria bacterium RYN_339]|nr:hypothetical protein [Cyanobacteria bacterium RYN_339]
MRRSLVRLCFAAALVGAPLTGCTDLNGLVNVPNPVGNGISIRLNADPSSSYVAADSSVTLSVDVTNPNGGTVSYAWNTNGGSLSSRGGNPVVWTAPSTPGTYTVQVNVTAGGTSAPGAIRFIVQ